ncbi:MAG: hypothetical protein ACYDDO_02855 [Acidiferrobacterales bacterium]
MAETADKPQHTPSAKHALDEVLRSLQDLVRNELHDVPAIPNPAATASGHPADKTVAAPTPNEIINNLEASLAALRPGIASTPHGKIGGAAPQDTSGRLSADRGPPAEFADAISPGLGTDSAIPPEIADDTRLALQALVAVPAIAPQAESTAVRVSRDKQIPPAGVQQELLLSDPANSPSDRRRKQSTALKSGAVHKTSDLQQTAAAPAVGQNIVETGFPFAGTHDDQTSDGLQPSDTVDLNWDDIPVLENAIDLAFETRIPVPAIEAPRHKTEPKSEPGLAASGAHRLAIQAAARLNLELRKSGKRGLNTAVVTRLAQILEETLAQGTANMENSPRNKD